MTPPVPTSFRRVVLGSAFLAATLVAFLPDAISVRAAETRPIMAAMLAQNDAMAATDAARDAAKAATDAARDAATEATRTARDAAAAAKSAAREAKRHGIDINVDIDPDTDANADAPPRRHRGLRLGIGGADRQYDSFDQFLDRDPALAAMVLGIVFIVFLTPILITALLIWYKMRKNRMQNETMLKLAEKGILPPGDALQAVGNGRAAAAISAAAAGAPLAEQARALRKQAAWSDLRRGVLMGAFGFALTFYAMLDDGSPNWFGLTLLFVGLGYCVLWYFEDRQAAMPTPSTPLPARGPGEPLN